MKGPHHVKTILGLLAALTIASTATAQSQTFGVCGKRDAVIASLENKYGEQRRSVGLQKGRGIVEVYASAETGTFTIAVTDPRGVTCLIAAGEDFEAIEINNGEPT